MHLICGVVAGLVIFAMSITGVALTYEKQIERWADGFEVAPPTPWASRLGPTELLTRAHAEAGKRPTALQLSSDPSAPARVSFGRESVSVNPYTGERFGEGSVGVHGFFQTMTAWHRWLGREGDGRDVGKAITGASNLAFVFILVSGPYLWWPKKWTWQQLRPIVLFRSGLSPKARDFNWHNVIGIWIAVPLLLVAGTGTFFSYSWTTDLLYALTGEERAQGGRGGGGRDNRKEALRPDYSTIDASFERVIAVEPNWTIITIRPALDPAAPVTFSIDRGSGFRPDLRSTLVLDPKTGDIIRHETYQDNKAAQNARFWIRFIHTGEAGGLAGQTLAGLASLAACFLVYTGWMLSWRRFRAWQARRK